MDPYMAGGGSVLMAGGDVMSAVGDYQGDKAQQGVLGQQNAQQQGFNNQLIDVGNQQAGVLGAQPLIQRAQQIRAQRLAASRAMARGAAAGGGGVLGLAPDAAAGAARAAGGAEARDATMTAPGQVMDEQTRAGGNFDVARALIRDRAQGQASLYPGQDRVAAFTGQQLRTGGAALQTGGYSALLAGIYGKGKKKSPQTTTEVPGDGSADLPNMPGGPGVIDDGTGGATQA